MKKSNIVKISDNEFYYYGYRILRSGEIISPMGRMLNAYFFTYPYSHVTMHINGKNIKKNRAMLIYELFSGSEVQKHKYIIQYRDNNSNNAAFDNLYLVNRSEYWQKLGEQKQMGRPVFTKEQKEEIRQKYQTGHISMRKLSTQYGVCLTTIQKIINTGESNMRGEVHEKNTDIIPSFTDCDHADRM